MRPLPDAPTTYRGRLLDLVSGPTVVTLAAHHPSHHRGYLSRPSHYVREH